MVNRILLRIKAVQILYTYYKGEDSNLGKAMSEMRYSVESTYELYCLLLLIVPSISKVASDLASEPSLLTLAPSSRFCNNRLAKQLSINKQLSTYAASHSLSWLPDHKALLKSLLSTIMKLDQYKTYSEAAADDYASDQEFWKFVFKHVIFKNDSLMAELEDMSIYWNDDFETVHSFAVKTIKRLSEDATDDAEILLPMFADKEVEKFGPSLLEAAIKNGDEFNNLINQHLSKNWDPSRISFIDRLVMQVAIAEIMSFPTIPLNVTLNEYINLAKAFGGEKSGKFVNGILDAVIKELQSQNKLNKVAFFSK